MTCDVSLPTFAIATPAPLAFSAGPTNAKRSPVGLNDGPPFVSVNSYWELRLQVFTHGFRSNAMRL